jgi:hypothetical protein
MVLLKALGCVAIVGIGFAILIPVIMWVAVTVSKLIGLTL